MNTESNWQMRLRDLAVDASDCQRQFMVNLANREREPKNSETFVDELAKLGEAKLAAVKFFKGLEEAGCGKFMAGRRGKKSRIEWSPTLKVTEIAKEFLRCLANADTPNSVFSKALRDVSESTSTQFHEHRFLLRPGVQVSIALPLDLTCEEAARLSEFLHAIPFRTDTIPATIT